MGKRRRADAAAVSAENEKTQFTCVKLTLNKWLKGDALSDHGQLKSGLNDIVQNLDQADWHATRLQPGCMPICLSSSVSTVAAIAFASWSSSGPWTRHSFPGEWPFTCGVAPVCSHEQPKLSAPAGSTCFFDMVDWGRRCLQIACGRRADKVFSKWPAALQRSAQLHWDLQDESWTGSEPRHETIDSSNLATGKAPCCSRRNYRCRSLQLMLIGVTVHQHRQLGTANIHPV